MNTSLLHARHTSLALIVTAVLSHGHLLPDCTGASPGTSGLTRLGRDLVRRAKADMREYSAHRQATAALGHP